MMLFHIRLANGDEIITQTKPSRDGNKYVLVSPLEVQNIVDKDSGCTAIVLYDYVPFGTMTSKIELNKNHIMTMSKVEGQMVEYYRASLEFSTLYGDIEKEQKIKVATDHLNKYIQERNEELTGTDEDEGLLLDDDEIMEALTSSNTTFH